MILVEGEKFTKNELKKRLRKMGVLFNEVIPSKSYYAKKYDEALKESENKRKIKDEIANDTRENDKCLWRRRQRIKKEEEEEEKKKEVQNNIVKIEIKKKAPLPKKIILKKKNPLQEVSTEEEKNNSTEKVILNSCPGKQTKSDEAFNEIDKFQSFWSDKVCHFSPSMKFDGNDIDIQCELNEIEEETTGEKNKCSPFNMKFYEHIFEKEKILDDELSSPIDIKFKEIKVQKKKSFFTKKKVILTAIIVVSVVGIVLIVNHYDLAKNLSDLDFGIFKEAFSKDDFKIIYNFSLLKVLLLGACFMIIFIIFLIFFNV